MTNLQPIRLIYRRSIPVNTRFLWAWHERPLAVDRLMPPFLNYIILKRASDLEPGAMLALRVSLFKFWQLQIQFEHQQFEKGKLFTDSLKSGPFKIWHHQHRFIAWKDHESVLEDSLEVVPTRFPKINNWIRKWLEKRLDDLFRWRHHITHWDLQLWKELPFARSTLVLQVNAKNHKLSKRLTIALQPFPVAGQIEREGRPLSRVHEGPCVVLNALDCTSNKLPAPTIHALRQLHAHTLVCLTSNPTLAWLDTLKVYGDRVICLHVGPRILTRHKWLAKIGWRPKRWVCDEDIESALFQIFHERLTSACYSFEVPPPSERLYERFVYKMHKVLNKLGIKMQPTVKTPPLAWPNFKLKLRAFSNFDQWLAIYSRL